MSFWAFPMCSGGPCLTGQQLTPRAKVLPPNVVHDRPDVHSICLSSYQGLKSVLPETIIMLFSYELYYLYVGNVHVTI